MEFKQKEIALNYLCSLIVPVEGKLLEVITEVAQSNKIRLNNELAKQMLNELNYYEMDIAYLGSDTEEDLDGKEEKITEKMLAGGLDDDENKKNLLI